jgi:hypothetical protein
MGAKSRAIGSALRIYVRVNPRVVPAMTLDQPWCEDIAPRKLIWRTSNPARWLRERDGDVSAAGV